MDGPLFSELFRIGAAAGDLGLYDFARRLLAMPGALTLLAGGLIGARRHRAAPTL